MLSMLFELVLRLSFYGSAASVLVFLCCKLLHTLKMPCCICSGVWLAVWLCFSCPFGIPVAVPKAASRPAVQTIVADNFFAAPAAVAAKAPATKGYTPTLFELFALIWFAVFLFMVTRALVSAVRLRRRISLSWREELPDGSIYYTGETIKTPFVAGIFRPRIYLPATLSNTEKQYILFHEAAHLAHRDHWAKPLFYAVLCVHWFNPFAWIAYRETVFEMEACCDEAVLKKLGYGVKAAYCQSLLRFAVRGVPAPVSFGESSVKSRIRRVLDYRRLPIRFVLAGAAFAASIGIVCLLRPTAEAAGVSSGNAAVSVSSASDAASFLSDSAASDQGAGSAASKNQFLAESRAESDALLAAQSAAAEANASALAANGALLWPVPGYRYISRWLSSSHKGVDISAERGTPILAATDGTVLVAGYDGNVSFGEIADTSSITEAENDALPLGEKQLSGYGYLVILLAPDGTQTLYAHCDALNVQLGDVVSAGQQIATVGTTGRSTGNHCHFEIFSGGTADAFGTWLDPADLFSER